jgi:hypothetical protein
LLNALGEQLGGYYDPTTETFFVLEGLPEAVAPLVIVHELTHALEDQHYDLDGRLATALENDDRLFALSALHEGSAMLVMTAWSIEAVARDEISQVDLASLGSLSGAGQAFEALPELLKRQFIGPYVLGTIFLVRGDLERVAGPYPGADAKLAFAEPPLSSEQVLHPEKYWDQDLRDEPAAEVDSPFRNISLGAVGGRWAAWEVEGAGVLGELGLAVLAEPDAGPPAGSLAWMAGQGWTNEAASGWDGDRWELWRRGTERSVILLTVWDSAADAKQFASALARTSNGRLRWLTEKGRVAVIAGSSPERERRLLKRLVMLR